MNSPTNALREEGGSSFLDSNENLENQLYQEHSVSKLESNVTIEEDSVSKLEKNVSIGDNFGAIPFERPRFFCDVCKINMAERDKIPHIKGKRHKANENKNKYPSQASTGRRREMNRDTFSRYGDDFRNRYNDYPPHPRSREFDHPRQMDFGPGSRRFGPPRDYSPGYGGDSRGYGQDRRGYGTGSRGYGGYGPDSRGYDPDFRRYGPGPTGRRENMYGRGMMDRPPWDGPGFGSRTDMRGMKRPVQGRYAIAQPKPKREQWHCDLCNISMQMHDKVHHLAGKKHQAQQDIKDGKIPSIDTNVCFRFREGDCKFGEDCKFVHDVTKSSEDGDDLVKKKIVDSAKEEIADKEPIGEESKQEDTLELSLEELEGEGGISGEGAIAEILENNEDFNGDIKNDLEADELDNIMEGIDGDIKEEEKLNNIMKGIDEDIKEEEKKLSNLMKGLDEDIIGDLNEYVEFNIEEANENETV